MSNVPPSFLQADGAFGVVGFNLQNTSGALTASRYVSFGQEFAQGTLLAGQTLTATINGMRQTAQLDPKTFYSDGSVNMAVLTLLQPEIRAHSTVQGVLFKSEATAGAGAGVVDVSKLLNAHPQSVNLSFADGSTANVDIGNSLHDALVGGIATKWMSGPNATQVRTSINVSGSLRLIVTFTAYADNTSQTSITFSNDIAMSSNGGPVAFSAVVTQDGSPVYSQSLTKLYQYQSFTARISSDGASVSPLNVQHDPAYLEKINAIPTYDLSNGVSQSVLDAEAQSISSATWNQPLGNNAITTYMPTTGARGDIGPTTLGNAAWLVTQDPVAATFALGQANAAQSVPWNIWDPSSLRYVDTDIASDIWTDGRGGAGSYTSGLTQQINQVDSGWTLDTAHQPDLSYYAYLLTGEQQYLDSLNAQAAWSISSTWPGARGANGLLVVGPNNQVRGAAWSLREIDEASYANPDGSAEKAYFTQIANANWTWLVAQIPAWTTLQGQAFGQVEGTYGSSPGNVHLPPWEQDYFASTAIQAAQHGNTDALTFLQWESNFLIGRFLSASNGFNPHDGVAYNIVVGVDNTRYGTWSQIGNATAAANESNGSGWVQSNGNYAELALSTLAGIISLTGSASAIQAYNWLLKSGAPQTDITSRARDFQLDIVPKLPSGMMFAPDGTISSQSALTAVTAPSSTSSTNDILPTAGTTSGVSSTSSSASPPASASTKAGLVLNLSEDAYQGDAQFTITVDGHQYGGIYTATASHSSGGSQQFQVGPLGSGTHEIGVSFINDLYDGSAQTDRNLYLNSATYNGQAIADTNQSFFIGNTVNFAANGDQQAAAASASTSSSASPPASASTKAGLVLNLSEDAYQGDAQFTITVDGHQYGGIYTATASHSSGGSQQFQVGPLGSGTHEIGVSFINDLYDGSAQTDRNLYLNSATYNGQAIADTNQSFFIGNTVNFAANGDQQAAAASASTSSSASPPASASTKAGLVLNLSEDAYQGDAQFTITVDGHQYGGIYTATASHSSGGSQQFQVGPLGSGTHEIGVSFINDLYDGSAQTDRNLYLNSATYNGQAIADTNQSFFIGNTVNFAANGDQQAAAASASTSSSASPPASASTKAGLVLDLSEDAYQGDAQFTITVDGHQYGGIYTATASHSSGGSQQFQVGPLGSGTHEIGVSFINDLYDGSAQTDRNLYLNSATYNGQAIADTNQSFFIGNTVNFAANGDQQAAAASASTSSSASPPASASTKAGLVLDLSEDAYQGDAQFTITVDGHQYGGIYTATASHSSGGSQQFQVGPLGSGTHEIGVSFINDLYDGSAQTDRNLYLNSATYNGQAIADTNQSFFIGNTVNFAANGDQQAAAASASTSSSASPPASASTKAGLVLDLSEDAYQGDAQFTITVDGHQYGGIYTATASHSSGGSQQFQVGPLGSGTHEIGVSFINDLYDGSAQTDRNLYLNSATYNGQALAGGTAAIYTNTTENFLVLGVLT